MGVVSKHLAPDEQIYYRDVANRLRTQASFEGGHVTVTHRRILFEPNWMSRLGGARLWSADWASIHTVLSQPGGGDGVTNFGLAGRRPHLVLVIPGAEPGVFSVQKFDALRAAVEAARTAAGL